MPKQSSRDLEKENKRLDNFSFFFFSVTSYSLCALSYHEEPLSFFIYFSYLFFSIFTGQNTLL